MAARAAAPVLGGLILLLGLGLVIGAVRYFGSHKPETDPDESLRGPAAAQRDGSDAQGYRWSPDRPQAPRRGEKRLFEDVLLGAVAIAAAIVVALVGRDLASKPRGDIVGQSRLIHLFTYNYGRAWPDTLDFSGMLAAFTLVAAGLMLLLMAYRMRHHVVAATVALACIWGLWGLDIYMVKTAPHWGQRETILAYYKDRKSAAEPVVAYQMNWKGENFYASNRIPAFVSSGAKFTEWVKGERDKGVKTMYFVTEHGRKSGLKNELGGGVKSFEPITTTWLDNKFGMFKAEFD
jgi:hypothetical protein